MTETEKYLREYWYARKNIRHLLIDLKLAKSAYQEACGNYGSSANYSKIKTKERSRLSPVEYSVILAVDLYRTELENIERKLEEERRRITIIEKIVKVSKLSRHEEDYVRLRFFENRNLEDTAQRMYCSIATCGRLRESALKKIEEYQKMSCRELLTDVS